MCADVRPAAKWKTISHSRVNLSATEFLQTAVLHTVKIMKVITYKTCLLTDCSVYRNLSSINNRHISRDLLLSKKHPLSPSVKPIKLWHHSSGPALTDCSHLVETADQLRLQVHWYGWVYEHVCAANSKIFKVSPMANVFKQELWLPQATVTPSVVGAGFSSGGKNTNHHDKQSLESRLISDLQHVLRPCITLTEQLVNLNMGDHVTTLYS